MMRSAQLALGVLVLLAATCGGGGGSSGPAAVVAAGRNQWDRVERSSLPSPAPVGLEA